MSGNQGYNKRLKSTTLRTFYNERDSYEIIWDNNKGTYVIYRNGKYLRNLSSNTNIEPSQISMYNSSKSYDAGETFVTYANPSSIDPAYREEAIYRCAVNAAIGESPELFPNKWIYQGASASQLTIDDISDLRNELNTRSKYDDFNDDFSVTNLQDGSKEISLNVDYITISDYNEFENVQPQPPAGIVLNPTGIGGIIEGDTYENISVTLNSKPTSNVNLSIVSQDAGAATVSVGSMTFTTLNWNVPQYFNVITIVDADANDEDVDVIISSTGSSDPNYDVISLPNKTFRIYNIVDNGNPAVIINPSTFSITEGGSSTVDVKLSSEPSGGGTGVDITFDNPNETVLTMYNQFGLPVQSATMSFNSSNWSDFQTLTFESVDGAITLDTIVTIESTLVDGSGNQFYAGINPDDINVTVLNTSLVGSDEVNINGVIIKTANAVWDDGGSGIYYPGNNPSNEANYGLLYTPEAIARLLAANPGYRLPTIDDFNLIRAALGGSFSGSNPIVFYTINGGEIFSDNISMWSLVTTNDWNNSYQLGLTPSGSYYPDQNIVYKFNEEGSLAYTKYNNSDGTSLILGATLSAFGLQTRTLTYYTKDYYIPVSYEITKAVSVRLVKDI